MTTMGSYCKLWKLILNEDKTVYTIFTRSTKLRKKAMSFKLNGKELKKEDNPVYLGVKLDARLSMKEFMKELKNAAVKRLNLVKRLAGTTWGTEKRTLRQIYMGYIRAK